MYKVDFCDGWSYGYIDRKDKHTITLPHDAMLSENRISKSKGGLNIAWFEGCDYWYEKEFDGSEELLSSNTILEFEGVYQRAEVYLNGERVAYWPYGYSNFYADVTGKIIADKNILRVLAKNAKQPNSRWYSGSGIYRPVNLFVLPKKHIKLNGIKIKTIDYTKCTIEVAVMTNAPGKVIVELLDQDHVVYEEQYETVNEIHVRIDIPNGKLWSPETPNLYRCHVKFFEDEQTVVFGVRSIECDAKNGLRINGARTILRGSLYPS